MAKRLIEIDPVTKIKVWHDYDSETDTSYIIEEQDIEGILSENKSMFSDSSYKDRGMKNDMLHVARIPNNIINKWLIEDGIDVFNRDHQKAVMRKLNDPEYRYLRTASGKY